MATLPANGQQANLTGGRPPEPTATIFEFGSWWSGASTRFSLATNGPRYVLLDAEAYGHMLFYLVELSVRVGAASFDDGTSTFQGLHLGASIGLPLPSLVDPSRPVSLFNAALGLSGDAISGATRGFWAASVYFSNTFWFGCNLGVRVLVDVPFAGGSALPADVGIAIFYGGRMYLRDWPPARCGDRP